MELCSAENFRRISERKIMLAKFAWNSAKHAQIDCARQYWEAEAEAAETEATIALRAAHKACETCRKNMAVAPDFRAMVKNVYDNME